MNPLSAIRLPVSPDMLRGANGLPSNMALPAIPQYELGKLAATTPTAPTAPLQPGSAIGSVNGNFESTLGRLVTDVAAKANTASEAAAGLGSGVPLHQVMLANEEASISFQLMVEVRNKLLESYQELMRMQV